MRCTLFIIHLVVIIVLWPNRLNADAHTVNAGGSQPARADQGNFGQFNYVQQRGFGPVKQQTGLPDALMRSRTHSLQLALQHSNVFMGGTVGGEQLLLDGEMSQLTLRYQHRLNACWQMNAQGEWIGHSEGWFDQPVDDWHQFFGLPDAERDQWPNNQLEYRYENNGESIELTEEVSGLSHAQLQIQRSLKCLPNTTVVRGGISLPIEELSEFTTNNAADAFVDVHSPWVRAFGSERVRVAGSIGLLVSNADQSVFDRRSSGGFGVLGINYQFRRHLVLFGQVDWHTPLFNSELRELGITGSQLTLGGRVQSPKHTIEFSFSEDSTVDSVPDIVVRVAYTRSIN